MSAGNSEALDIFLKIAGSPRASWDIVELVGRGILAETAKVKWMAAEGKRSISGENLYDFLMQESSLCDDLNAFWACFNEGISDSDAKEKLTFIVERFEGWGSRSSAG